MHLRGCEQGRCQPATQHSKREPLCCTSTFKPYSQAYLASTSSWAVVPQHARPAAEGGLDARPSSLDGAVDYVQGSSRGETPRTIPRHHHRLKALLGNPAHADKIVYRPSHVFTEESRKGRVYTEMWTGNWWHAVQVRQHEHGLRVLVHLYLTPQHRVSSPRARRLRPSLFPPTKPSSHNFLATDRRTRST